MTATRAILIWAAVLGVTLAPMVAALFSPLLAWRDGVYIAAGFAGITAMALLVVQPMMAAAVLPGLSVRRARQTHRWVGGAIVLTTALHVAGLWVTSPPDVVDALLFASPTAFSVWGVIAMWAIVATGVVALLRRRVRFRRWFVVHALLAVVIAATLIAHVALIDGTMEPVSKWVLSMAVAAATGAGIWHRWPHRMRVN